MSQAKPKGTRGGRRPGSGRKPLYRDRARITLDLEREELETLDAVALRRRLTRTALLRGLIRRLGKPRR